jgi:hypothetical protein
VLGAAEGLLVSTATLLALFIGFCLFFTLRKLRAGGRHSTVVRSLDDLVGRAQPYLRLDAPRGTVDQLNSPELLESRRRKSA